ncbi:hypothetical protein [Pedobacter gandavensis]|uniref:Uncharacterized protein n=1 Tax=Pedobacter gandavensis TaxID=2679963 RepID=A0ABR6F382_9SPHI|nr:hypothetical protein [Pedobacter gandavensis]MBB2151707.1 hypothetical protein [Pedobacter gandavensis]
MKSKITALVVLLLICKVSFAQRIPYTDLIGLYADASYDRIEEMDSKLKKLSSNWSDLKAAKNGSKLALTWKYQYESSTVGYLRIYKDTDPKYPIRLKFAFPYSSQFNEYKTWLNKTAKVVNRLTEGGANSVVYESESLTTIITTYPANLKKFYEDGLPVEHYEILMHIKL